MNLSEPFASHNELSDSDTAVVVALEAMSLLRGAPSGVLGTRRTGDEPRHGLCTPMAWTEYAECRAVEPELFFPVSNQGPGKQQVEQARAICARCTTRLECLDWAVTNKVQHGVWGGLSEDERRPLIWRRQHA